MTQRLEHALEQLSPEDLAKVTEYAERLAGAPAAGPQASTHRYLQLDWLGQAADAYPEHATGVDAAHAAGRMISESLERTLGR